MRAAEFAMELPRRLAHHARVQPLPLCSSVANARRNFDDLHAKVAIDRARIIVQSDVGEEVVWLCVSELLLLGRPALSCEDILAELLA